MDITNFIEFEDEDAITSFRGEFGFLSNFHKCTIRKNLVGKVYLSSEHYYVAHKAKTEKDHEYLRNHDFDGLKRAGREIDIREDWEEVKVEIMMEALLEKFTQNPELGQKLMDTGDRLIVEGNDWCDNFYGDCRCSKCVDINGENILGKLLMSLREYLRSL